MKKQNDIREIIDKIIRDNSIDDAIIRLNGYLKEFHWDSYLRTKLGNLYMEQEQYIQAGKLLYLKKVKTRSENDCVDKFCISCGNRAMTIFHKIKGNNNSKPPRGIDMETNTAIFNLFNLIARQEGSLSKDVVTWIWNYERIRNIEIVNGWLKL